MKSFLKYHLKDRALLARDQVHYRWSGHVPLLVFTMAKVGSLSVHLSVKRSTSIPSFHIHTLDNDEVQTKIKACFDRGVYPDSRSPVPFILKEIIDKRKPYKVISLFRNPIERNISAFFDAFEFNMGMPAEHFKGGLNELQAAFFEHVNHRYVVSWFDDYFLPATGINVYDFGFDKELGYGKIEVENTSILLMNTAIEDGTKQQLIADFLEVPNFELVNANVTSQSKASGLYEAFKNHMSFDQAYINDLLGSRFFEHFFTPEEALRTREKWMRT